MKDGLDIPVALMVFARPDSLARVISSLRTARPRLVFVVADGPRPSHPRDPANCAAARGVIETIDWPCEIRRLEAERNMGCDPRIATGLDWIFQQVEEAIVLEDDVIPHPSFFPWCAAMLKRYRHVPEIMHISGRNELQRWGTGDADHHLVRFGSSSGWASWARAWRAVDRSIASDPARARAARNELGRLKLDPLLARQQELLLDAIQVRPLVPWDTTWNLCRTIAGGFSIVPPVNLMLNVGFGPDATHTILANDPRAALKIGESATVRDTFASRPFEPDNTYDRWTLMFELMASYRNPAMIRRLARTACFQNRIDPSTRLHLAPFAYPAEGLAVLEHLRAASVTTPVIDKIAAELRKEISTNADNAHVA
jgi:hypothetical protein